MTLDDQNLYEVDGHQRGRGHYIKDPASVEKYIIQWGRGSINNDPLDVSSETIATSAWAVPAGLTEVSSSKGARSASIVLSGGTAGDMYTVSNTVTTGSGKTFKRSIYIRCKSL